MCFFFYKQKTAYEMRISDWSSDVCASDLSTSRATQSAEPEPEDLEKITVTGTRIRGGSTPSPVIIIGSERIREEGFTDLGEAIRSVPQNFSGGQNPGVLMGNVIGAGLANQNLTGGSALNLRGLGQIGRASCRARVCQSV